MLETLVSPVMKRSMVFTIVGEGGMGKTSLAAMFPDPIFVRTEDGSQSMAGLENVAMFPTVCNKVQTVFDQVKAVRDEEHGFRTLVIDSITRLAAIVEREVVESDPKAKSINQAMGGYGAGFSACAARHQNFRELCEIVRIQRNMHIVFLAHATTETVDLPDQEAYSRFTIRMHKNSLSAYTDDADVVALIRLKTFVSGEGDKLKKAASDGSRVLQCHAAPSSIGKNRLGITKEMPLALGENPFAPWLS